MKFLKILEETLKEDSHFVGEDGRILKTKVYDACMGMDKALLERLINNEILKSHFFVEVNGTLVFDKMKFAWVLESREFLPDSYTMFKNKIGLANSKGNLSSQQSDVTLVWPYKDCVLEGGQTKEDQKRDEIFYNETLAPDEVNRLLYPKVFTNSKRYSKDGVEEITEIKDNDNLIIKGNNLLALASLVKRYEGKIKCIYIDPPYYFQKRTGTDTFLYNSNFHFSTWLGFMKDRLGMDPGAIYKGRKESDDNLALGKAVAAELRRHGVEVIETRTADKTVSLEERSSIANVKGCDYFISFHRNAFKPEQAKGVETFTYTSPSTKSVQLAKKIQTALASVGFANRGVKTANFHVLRETKAPAVLMEVGFIDNTGDNQLFDRKRDEIIKALVKAILSQLGISYAAPSSGTQTDRGSGQTLYRVMAGSYVIRGNAERQVQRLKAAGFDATIMVYEKP